MAWPRLSCVRWIALCSCWTLSASPQDIRGESDVVVQPPAGVVPHPVLLVGRLAPQAGNRNCRFSRVLGLDAQAEHASRSGQSCSP